MCPMPGVSHASPQPTAQAHQRPRGPTTNTSGALMCSLQSLQGSKGTRGADVSQQHQQDGGRLGLLCFVGAFTPTCAIPTSQQRSGSAQM